MKGEGRGGRPVRPAQSTCGGWVVGNGGGEWPGGAGWSIKVQRKGGSKVCDAGVPATPNNSPHPPPTQHSLSNAVAYGHRVADLLHEVAVLGYTRHPEGSRLLTHCHHEQVVRHLGKGRGGGAGF